MILKKVWIAVLALTASVFMVASANAVPILPNDGIIHGLAFHSYEASSIAVPVNGSFTHEYKFNVADNPISFTFGYGGSSPTIFSALQIEVFKGSTPLGILDLFTVSNPFVVAAGLAPGTGIYTLVVSGTTNPGFAAGYGMTISAIPVPPALLLLVSGLMGAGFMGRRKVSGSKVAV